MAFQISYKYIHDLNIRATTRCVFKLSLETIKTNIVPLLRIKTPLPPNKKTKQKKNKRVRSDSLQMMSSLVENSWSHIKSPSCLSINRWRYFDIIFHEMTFGINKLGKKNPRAFEMQIKHRPMARQRIIREGGWSILQCGMQYNYGNWGSMVYSKSQL